MESLNNSFQPDDYQMPQMDLNSSPFGNTLVTWTAMNQINQAQVNQINQINQTILFQDGLNSNKFDQMNINMNTISAPYQQITAVNPQLFLPNYAQMTTTQQQPQNGLTTIINGTNFQPDINAAFVQQNYAGQTTTTMAVPASSSPTSSSSVPSLDPQNSMQVSQAAAAAASSIKYVDAEHPIRVAQLLIKGSRHSRKNEAHGSTFADFPDELFSQPYKYYVKMKFDFDHFKDKITKQNELTSPPTQSEWELMFKETIKNLYLEFKLVVERNTSNDAQWEEKPKGINICEKGRLCEDDQHHNHEDKHCLLFMIQFNELSWKNHRKPFKLQVWQRVNLIEEMPTPIQQNDNLENNNNLSNNNNLNNMNLNNLNDNIMNNMTLNGSMLGNMNNEEEEHSLKNDMLILAGPPVGNMYDEMNQEVVQMPLVTQLVGTIGADSPAQMTKPDNLAMMAVNDLSSNDGQEDTLSENEGNSDRIEPSRKKRRIESSNQKQLNNNESKQFVQQISDADATNLNNQNILLPENSLIPRTLDLQHQQSFVDASTQLQQQQAAYAASTAALQQSSFVDGSGTVQQQSPFQDFPPSRLVLLHQTQPFMLYARRKTKGETNANTGPAQPTPSTTTSNPVLENHSTTAPSGAQYSWWATAFL